MKRELVFGTATALALALGPATSAAATSATDREYDSGKYAPIDSDLVAEFLSHYDETADGFIAYKLNERWNELSFWEKVETVRTEPDMVPAGEEEKVMHELQRIVATIVGLGLGAVVVSVHGHRKTAREEEEKEERRKMLVSRKPVGSDVPDDSGQAADADTDDESEAADEATDAPADKPSPDGTSDGKSCETSDGVTGDTQGEEETEQ